jgi:3-oxoacyl-(acyl-carrier-protein) synthase
VRSVAIAGTAVVDGPIDQIGVPARARKMMAPAAALATAAVDRLLRELAWNDREDIGCYLGVGASGGAIADFIALLRESLADGAFSTARFGTRGLAACNPLLAFQLMNNFTMCHAAIHAQLGGPNGALFSRGAGTVTAIAEAVYAVASGECDRAIAGGADAPTHPATVAELAREGHAHSVRDAAAVVGLEVATPGSVIVERCRVAAGRGRGIAGAIAEAVGDPGRIDLAVIAPGGTFADDALRSWLAARAPRARVVACPDDSLAAAMGIAVVAAGAQIAPGERALVLGLGVDRDPSAVVLAREAA